MTDTIYACPSPDECSFTTDDVGELARHVNTDHCGEYRRDDWPDTAAGRAARARDTAGKEDEDDE